MSKYVKDLITDALRNRYADKDSALWIELIGVDGNTTNAFRRALHENEMHLEVVKNSLFRRAVGDGPLAPLAKSVQGPVALVTGGESLVDVAKLIDEWKPKIKPLKLKGAVIEGEWLDEERVQGLAKMPTKRDLQAKVAGCALSPGANLASAINSGGGNIAGCLKALIEKLENGESVAA